MTKMAPFLRFQNENFQTLREKRSPKVNRGARLGQEGGLRLLVDAEGGITQCLIIIFSKLSLAGVRLLLRL